MKKKKKSIWKLIHGQVGHDSVRRCSHIMMFDQGKSRFCNGVNELMRMTLTRGPFCSSVENAGPVKPVFGLRSICFHLAA